MRIRACMITLVVVGCSELNPEWQGLSGAEGSTTDSSGTVATGDEHDGATGENGSEGESTGVDVCLQTPPVDGPCDASCDSCEQGTCVIACTEEQQCAQTTLTCPAETPCHVRCSAKESCS
jgi:hypothetical protein